MSAIAYPLSLGLIFAAIFLLAWNILPRRAAGLAVRGISVQRDDLSKLPSTLFRLLYPLLEALAPLFKRIRWQNYRQTATVALQKAGIAGSITVDHLLAMKVIFAVFTPFAVSTFFEVFRNPALFVGAGIGGFFLPDRFVSDLRKKRERQILRSLPGAVDVLSLSVEAGLEFLIAIQRVVERGGMGALRDELATILNDIRLGKSRGEALKSFSQRVEIPEVSSFVSVLVQADILGASIGPVLQQQAERMRVERFQRAEKAGAKATQKILFPLVLFIFPAVLIVIIGPVALQFIYGP
jgi:tight adherence protein C